MLIEDLFFFVVAPLSVDLIFCSFDVSSFLFVVVFCLLVVVLRRLLRPHLLFRHRCHLILVVALIFIATVALFFRAVFSFVPVVSLIIYSGFVPFIIVISSAQPHSPATFLYLSSDG
jgi:hypothetical protein